MGTEIRVAILTDSDIVAARQQGRALAARVGLSATDATLLASAISEIARNIVVHAGRGEIALAERRSGGRVGVLVVASDKGPGIPRIDDAMQDGFSTANSLGLGLPGARRLVDEFDIQSEVGVGTVVTMTKWVT